MNNASDFPRQKMIYIGLMCAVELRSYFTGSLLWVYLDEFLTRNLNRVGPRWRRKTSFSERETDLERHRLVGLCSLSLRIVLHLFQREVEEESDVFRVVVAKFTKKKRKNYMHHEMHLSGSSVLVVMYRAAKGELVATDNCYRWAIIFAFSNDWSRTNCNTFL